MNRNYYCKVNSQEEADKLLKVLSNIDENILTTTSYIKNSWNIIGFHESKWCLLDSSYLKKDFIKVPASELIDYVTGKKLDKDALLEEAKRRYPVGTKFKSVYKGTECEVINSDFTYNITYEAIQNDNGGWVYQLGTWAEIIEEPKIEAKFEKGKWYKINNSWYAKFKTIHGLGKYWQHSEVITSKGDHRFDIGNLENTWKDVSIALVKDLSEIQQYLPAGHPDKFTTPVVKEEFVLPEKWHVVVTKDNQQVLSDWRGTKVPIGYIVGIDSWNGKKNSKGHNPKNSIKGDTFNFGIEITFDQFKKYILKQEVKEEVKSMKEWSVGSYVVWLIEFKEFKIKVGTIDEISEAVDSRGMGSTKLFGSTAFLQRNNKDLKWFPTLQEAQKFSDELLGKSKTELRIEDLVEGEFYYCETNISKKLKQWVYKYLTSTINPTSCTHAARIDGNYYDKNSSVICAIDYVKNLRLATSSEKKWLKTCIKQDKFIPQSELDKYDDEGNLMESKEYPEYVELVKPKGYNTLPKENGGTIFNINFTSKTPGIRTIKELYKDYPQDFKSSTKAAYEAQFKKDEKFKAGDVLYIMDSKKNRDNYPQCIGTLITIRSISEDTYTPDTYWISYTPERFGGGGYRVNGNGLKPGVDIRKALPYEIPVENSVKQNPLVFEECGKFPTIIERYTVGIDPIPTTGMYPKLEDLFKNPESHTTLSSKKTPDLIDKSKVEVKIKRTKVKQIKL